MKNRYSTSMTMSETDYAAFKKDGRRVIDIFRAGLGIEGFRPKVGDIPQVKVIKTKKQAEEAMGGFMQGEYGCGCKRTESTLCPKHGRY